MPTGTEGYPARLSLVCRALPDPAQSAAQHLHRLIAERAWSVSRGPALLHGPEFKHNTNAFRQGLHSLEKTF